MNTPAGWYPDEQDRTKQRYWNGSRWTDHTAPAEVVSEPTAMPGPATEAAPATAHVPLLHRGWVLPSAAGLALVVGLALGTAASGGAGAFFETQGCGDSVIHQ